MIVALADQPFIQAQRVDDLISVFRSDPGLDYAASGNEGDAMPPVLFSRSLFTELERLDGDKGARGIFQSPDYRGIVLNQESQNYFMDADTTEDFDRLVGQWQNRNN